MDNKKTELEVNALKLAKQYDMLKRGTTVIAAFSGGADSAALLHWLISVAQNYGIKVMAAHVNHNLRGAESDGDESFVTSACEKYGIELFVKSVDVKGRCEETGESTELAARSLRYQFFEELIKEHDAYIATAHTSSDNLETVLLNLTRGTALSGVCGIPPVRGRFIRPLIGASRRMVVDYCEKKSLAFVTDSSNLTNDYSRNFVRHEIVPKLEKLNPAVTESVFRLSQYAREDDTALDAQAEKLLKIEGEEIRIELTDEIISSPSVLKRAVAAAADKLGASDISAKQIEAVCRLACSKKTGKTVCFADGYTARTEYDVLLFGKKNEKAEKEQINIELCDCFYDKYATKVKIIVDCKKKFKNFEKNYIRNGIDCGKIKDSIVLRTRKDGDKYYPIGRAGSKKLKKLFIDEKIPQYEREKMPVVCDGDNVIWTGLFGSAQEYRITEETECAAIFEYTERKR